MAIVTKNDPLLSNLSGKIGNLLFKQYRDKTVVTVMPDVVRKRKSIVQKFRMNHFRKAVRFAQSVLRDPARRKEMEGQVPEGQLMYHYLIRLYIETNPLMDSVDD